jgi:RNA polymerase sigma-70 factor (ECF subfamily)
VFDFSFSEVAAALQRSDAACRQLAARARAHVREVRPRGAIAPATRSGEIEAKHARLLSAFAATTRSGDLSALTHVLASDVRVVTDGGGKIRAALEVIEGAERVARFLVDATRPGQWWREDFTMRFATINGPPGMVVSAPEVGEMSPHLCQRHEMATLPEPLILYPSTADGVRPFVRAVRQLAEHRVDDHDADAARRAVRC